MALSEAGAARKPPARPRRARSSGTAASRKPTAIDKHVGRRLRLLRQIHQMSLEKLAEIVDVTPQQVQKYEIGETRISASRIFELSKIFHVPLAWFYDDLKAATSAEVLARIGQFQACNGDAGRQDAEASQEALLVTYFAQLAPEMRRIVVDMARTLSELAVRQAK